MQTLRRRARERLFPKVLVGRAVLNATDEAGDYARMQHKLLIVRNLVVEAQRVNLSPLRDWEVADQAVERDESRRRWLARGDKVVRANRRLQKGGVLSRKRERGAGAHQRNILLNPRRVGGSDSKECLLL